MKAIEKRQEIRRAKAQWKKAFSEGATLIGGMGGVVMWQPDVGIWGFFGDSERPDGSVRDWNAFGQVPTRFRNNMVVEINPPRFGRNLNLQGCFAQDSDGSRWVLHQGRMSVPDRRVTEADFIAATGLAPVEVSFADGTKARFHRVAPLDKGAAVLQDKMAAFLAQCARARLSYASTPKILDGLRNAEAWERGLSPEVTGEYEVSACDAVTAKRRHADVWHALVLELKRRDIVPANERVARYGPDFYTYKAPLVLFEIKSKASAADVFEGVGQLQIYERLLKGQFRKVLVLPLGMGQLLGGALLELGISTVEYSQKGRGFTFDGEQLAACLQEV